MFMGEYRHSLDAKNRLIIPSRFRDQLGETFYVTRGFDECLSVYTAEQFDKLMTELQKLPSTKKEVRQYVRSVTSKAVECSFDSQGRIQLSPALKNVAGIEKMCAVIGANDHVEIWSEEKWDAYDSAAGSSFENAAETLTEFLK